MHDYIVDKVSMLLVSRTSRGRKQCFFCGEKAAIDAHHKIPQSITRRIPRLVRAEVLDEIFGKNPQRRYPLCKNCHKKLHSVLRPFEKSILLFLDIRSPEKRIVEQMMKDKILMIIGKDGRGEDYADLERIVAKLERRGVSKEESVRLMKELRDDGPIYFVLPDEGSARYDPSFVNKITCDYESVMKARRKVRA
jgi:hypothetical protein